MMTNEKYSFENNKSIGLKLRDRRKEIGMTQKHLGDLVGISSQQIQKYEAGISSMSFQMMIDLSKALNVDPSFFIVNFQMKEEDDLNESSLDDKMLTLFKSITDEHLKKRIINIVSILIGDNCK